MELALGSAKELSFEKQTRIISATVLQGFPPPLVGVGHSWWEGFLTVSKKRNKRACEGKELDLGKAGGKFCCSLEMQGSCS